MIKTIAIALIGSLAVAATVSLDAGTEKTAKVTEVTNLQNCLDHDALKTRIHWQTCRLELPR